MTTHQQIISIDQLGKLISAWVTKEEINMKIISGEVIEGIIVSLRLRASDDQNSPRVVVVNIAKGNQLTFATLLLAKKDRQEDHRQQHGWIPKGQGGF
ncbi:MAG: hypothetical protein Q4A37_00330 [Candidatus Saccharibacteria bacterium]|nr:hypothetical protein [Candidatus Saccharibacteria bacterium]